ncbi:MAG: alpha/beta hydrolase [Gallionella sp.]|nr:alpha/beta hydrolase [Gallionella sp.]
MLLQPAWASDATTETHEECIEEPIFEGRVCTVQANRDASIGVVLIHGLGGSVELDWLSTIPALAKDFHVVAFDLPGFGKSDKGSQSYSPTNYARLAHFLADHYLKNKPYHVVGHSMGGAVALRFAAQRPLRFQRLVLIDAAGILHPLVLTKFQAGSMMERASGVQQLRGFAERLSGRILEQAERLPMSPTEIADTALGRDRVLQGGPEKIAALALAGENFSHAISSVSAPTLILWGDNDLVVPLRTGKVLASRMPRARLEIIPDSGHVPMLEQTERLNTLVRKHLLASDEVLAEYYRDTSPPPAFTSKRAGTCTGETGKVFEGDYRTIDLRDCSNITIRNARVGRLNTINSRLILVNTDILGKDVGLNADSSDITVTNGDISGGIAISATSSRLDLAGVRLKGTQASVKGVSSKFIFSVSMVSSQLTSGHLHTFKSMIDEEL